MAFQRAQWHSGLTYQQTCENCKTVFQYTDYSLDFRPWYADGYVDCPTCKRHLRHNEKFAMNAPESAPVVNVEEPVAQEIGKGEEVFCPNCGNKYGEGHRFCSMCGAKRN